MAKISKSHHITKKGVVKKNPSKKLFVFSILANDLYVTGDGVDDFEYEYARFKVLAASKKEAEKVFDTDYALNFDATSGNGDWTGREFEIEAKKVANIKEIQTYPRVNDILRRENKYKDIVYDPNATGFSKTIKVISKEELDKLFASYDKYDTYKPLGLFIIKDGSAWIAVDNSTGEAWTEDFKTRSQAEVFLRNNG